jgi:hypothetical protein
MFTASPLCAAVLTVAPASGNHDALQCPAFNCYGATNITGTASHAPSCRLQIDFAPPTESNDWDGEEAADATSADNGEQSIDWQEIVQAVSKPAAHEHASATTSASSSRRCSSERDAALPARAEGLQFLEHAGPTAAESLEESYNADSCDIEPAPEDLELTSNDWP